MPNDPQKGILLSAAAFIFWGLTPFYFKALSQVAPMETVSHRIIWSAVLLTLLLLITNRSFFREVLNQIKTHGWVLLATALLLTLNWLTYIYAVVTGKVLEASLGYFYQSARQCSSGSGFSERTSYTDSKKLPYSLQASPSRRKFSGSDSFPTLALVMAGTFGIYGLIRKKASIGRQRGIGSLKHLSSYRLLSFTCSI